MARQLTEGRLTTRTARAALTAGLHWRAIDPEVHLGYRKGNRGGRWLVRWYAGAQRYRQATLGVADDALTIGTMSFEAAIKAARLHVEADKAAENATLQGPAATVRSVVMDYIRERDARDTTREKRPTRSDASRRLTKHVLDNETFASLPLHRLTEVELVEWRSGLSGRLKQVSRTRLASDLKASLNRAHRLMRKRLPADFAETVRIGLKFESGHDEPEPVARENQILADDQIRRILSSVIELDQDEDFARLVAILAATGTRFSQARRLQVRDVQVDRDRIMMPTSRKGRPRAASYIPVPVGKDIIAMLRPAIDGRMPDDPLLVRWRRVQVGIAEWKRVSREPWRTPSEMLRPWHAACAHAELAGTVPYALRHSSIVRAIRRGLPIRLVAALHDTSVVMIERHYGRWIADGLDDLAAKAVIPLL